MQGKEEDKEYVVKEKRDGTFSIHFIDGIVINLCPCCDRPMKSMRAAMLVADALTPAVEKKEEGKI